MGRLFTFTHLWRVPASLNRVYAALAAAEDYPLWWPQVRSAERIDERTGRSSIRSVLPYTLDLVLTTEIEDPVQGILRTRLTGDLDGFAEFRLRPTGAGAGAGREVTEAAYRQQVRITDRRLGAVAGPLAPLLRANHWVMMRAGERGLAAHLTSG